MQKFSQTKFFKVLVVVIFFWLLILFVPVSFFQPLRSTALFLAAPFQKVLYFISVKTAQTGDFVFSIGQLKNDNENLIRENQSLLAENARLADVEKENKFLREQLNFLPKERFEFIPAAIISQDSQNLGNWMEIDKGSEDGLAEGMPVVVSKGVLIGRLQDVYAHNAKVILLTNPKSAVNGVAGENGTKGIIKGEYGLGIMYDMVLQTDSLQIGDDIITSGISGSLPRGLYVGKIQEIHPSNDHLFQQATVASPVQIAKLQFVFVIKNSKQ